MSVAIFALGVVLRGYPRAQAQILPKSGLHILLNILKNEKPEFFRCRMKVIHLLNDVYLQCLYNDIKISPAVVYEFSLEDYERSLNASIYCDATVTFIENDKTEIARDLDVALDLVAHLDRTKHLCLSIWTQSALLRHLMLILRHKFGDHTTEDITDGGHLVEHINSLFDALEFLPMQEIKDEL